MTITDRSAAEGDLDRIVSGVAGMPGFVAGYWVPSAADAGVATVIFDSEEAAKGFASFLQSAPAEPGVALDRESIEVGQVMAHA
ncbi:MAG: hypothetical protein WBU92_01175 [Candidatus Dormiibacterota bacterium]